MLAGHTPVMRPATAASLAWLVTSLVTCFLHKHSWKPGIPPLPCLSPLSVSSYHAESWKVVRCGFPFISLCLTTPRWCSLFSDVKYTWGWCSRNVWGPGHEVAKDWGVGGGTWKMVFQRNLGWFWCPANLGTNPGFDWILAVLMGPLSSFFGSYFILHERSLNLLSSSSPY